MANSSNCLNCGTPLSGNYCAHCGQKASTQRITATSLASTTLQSLSNLDKGYLFNLKHLTLAPGETIRAYLAGKRKDVFKPIQYAIIAVTLFTLVDAFLATITVVNSVDMEQISRSGLSEKLYNYGKFTRRNLKYFWFLNIFFFALPTYWFFKKYNFTEHLVINAFILGHASLAGALTTPISDAMGIVAVFNPIPFTVMAIMYYFVFRPFGEMGETIAISLLAVMVGFLLFWFLPLLVVLPFL